MTESHSEFLTRMLRDLSMIRHDVARQEQHKESVLLKSIVAQLDTVMCGVEVVKEYYEERGK